MLYYHNVIHFQNALLTSQKRSVWELKRKKKEERKGVSNRGISSSPLYLIWLNEK